MRPAGGAPPLPRGRLAAVAGDSLRLRTGRGSLARPACLRLHSPTPFVGMSRPSAAPSAATASAAAANPSTPLLPVAWGSLCSSVPGRARLRCGVCGRARAACGFAGEEGDAHPRRSSPPFFRASCSMGSHSSPRAIMRLAPVGRFLSRCGRGAIRGRSENANTPAGVFSRRPVRFEVTKTQRGPSTRALPSTFSRGPREAKKREMGAGLKRNLFDARPLFRLTPAPARARSGARFRLSPKQVGSTCWAGS